MSDWWASPDFGGEHQLAVAEQRPDNEWFGPFRTFTEARQFLLDAGAYEAHAIHASNVWWRSRTKAQLIEAGLVVGLVDPPKEETT